MRGNTQRAIVAMLREAGAAEVHVRISSPPVSWPCFYGIDFATRAELIAGHESVPEICASIGADSLGYISLDGLTAATTIAADRLCRACFDGIYPVPVVESERGKYLREPGTRPLRGSQAVTGRPGDQAASGAAEPANPGFRRHRLRGGGRGHRGR